MGEGASGEVEHVETGVCEVDDGQGNVDDVEPSEVKVYVPPNITHACTPRTMDDIWDLAENLAKSRYIKSRTPVDIFAIMMTGAEMGFLPMQSLRVFNVINDKMSMSADGMVAKVRQSGLCVQWRAVETTLESCTYMTIRVGDDEPTFSTYTMEDAVRAKLADKDNWVRMPFQMLKARAKSILARDVYPDVILGMYTQDEQGDY